MSTSPNLLIGLLSSSQNNKYVTVNEAIDLLDQALAQQLAITMTDADYTFATGQGSPALQNMVFVMSGALTAGRNVIVPNNEKLYIFKNNTSGGHNLTVKTAAGTGVVVMPTSGYVLVYCDAVNVVAAAASGANAFTQLSDVPASYSGAANNEVQVNVGATGLVFVPKPFPIGIFHPGVGADNELVLYIPLTENVTFPAGAVNSEAEAHNTTLATADATYTFYRVTFGSGSIPTWTAFATVTFETDSLKGVWVQGSDETFAPGDVLACVGPATHDATLADFGITLRGIRN